MYIKKVNLSYIYIIYSTYDNLILLHNKLFTYLYNFYCESVEV